MININKTFILSILMIFFVSNINLVQSQETTIINNTHNTSDPVCNICEVAAGIVRFEVKMSNNTLGVIEEITKVLCYLIGGKSVYQVCDKFCNDIQEIANWIEKGFTDKTICEKLGMCKKKNND